MLKGRLLDEQTRCTHYHSELDIIAIKFKCCNSYYPCFQCHEETTDHKPEIWEKTELHEKAILCGVCKCELTIFEYLNCNSKCPNCQSAFNPKCENHYHLYFDL
jgi:uncharacterized CHY-type Zn-finger protein